MSSGEDVVVYWPYTEPHVSVERWKVDLPAGTMKGISRDDALELAEDGGGTAFRSTALLITGGPDEGTEILAPWRKIVGS